MLIRNSITVLVTALVVTTGSVQSASAVDVDLDYEWQLERLMNPSKQELQLERAGQVFIYRGLKDNEIERALDAQYDRIENMMFVNTVLTDEEGNPLQDPNTVGFVADDGC